MGPGETRVVGRVYLDQARVNHYRDVLDDISIVLPPMKEGLSAANTAFNGHVVKLKTLFKFSKTRGPTAQRRALKKSLRNDHQLYREATRGNSWEEIIQYVRRELDSRISSHAMGHGSSVTAVVNTLLGQGMETQSTNVEGTSSKQIEIQSHVAALAALGYNLPTQSGSTPNRNAPNGGKRQNFKAPRRGNENTQDRRQNSNRGPYGRSRLGQATKERKTYDTPFEGTCHWCGLKGHTVRDCQGKAAGQASVYPTKPPGVTWADHKAANAKK